MHLWAAYGPCYLSEGSAVFEDPLTSPACPGLQAPGTCPLGCAKPPAGVSSSPGWDTLLAFLPLSRAHPTAGCDDTDLPTGPRN